jgi:hypothetical protein
MLALYLPGWTVGNYGKQPVIWPIFKPMYARYEEAVLATEPPTMDGIIVVHLSLQIDLAIWNNIGVYSFIHFVEAVSELCSEYIAVSL